MVTLRGTTMSLLRINYRLSRIPLRFIEAVLTRFDEQAPIRLAYEEVLIECDRAAAQLLGDQDADRRATELHRHTAAVREAITRANSRRDHHGLILLDEQRDRFHRRRRHRQFEGIS